MGRGTNLIRRRFLALVVFIGAGCNAPGRDVGAGDSARGESAARSAPTARVDSLGAPTSTPRQGCAEWEMVFRAAAEKAGIAATEVGAPRDTTMAFVAPDAPAEPSCLVEWVDSTAKDAPINDAFARAQARGWKQRDWLYSADGPDGTALAFSRGDVACIVSASWDGDDDSDSAYVPKPGFTVSASCFRNRPDPR